MLRAGRRLISRGRDHVAKCLDQRSMDNKGLWALWRSFQALFYVLSGSSYRPNGSPSSRVTCFLFGVPKSMTSTCFGFFGASGKGCLQPMFLSCGHRLLGNGLCAFRCILQRVPNLNVFEVSDLMSRVSGCP